MRHVRGKHSPPTQLEERHYRRFSLGPTESLQRGVNPQVGATNTEVEPLGSNLQCGGDVGKEGSIAGGQIRASSTLPRSSNIYHTLSGTLLLLITSVCWRKKGIVVQSEHYEGWRKL